MNSLDMKNTKSLNSGILQRQSKVTSGIYTTIEAETIRLDVRSDIYSLGATLYHLILGRKLAVEAIDVLDLEADTCSPAVAAIILKAMSPDAEMRYQSAKEMLTAFRRLYKTDRRAVALRRNQKKAIISMIFMMSIGTGCTFLGLKQMEQKNEALMLSEYSVGALKKGDVEQAIRYALSAIPEKGDVFSGEVTAQAQKALADALGVYNLADGFKNHSVFPLSAIPFSITSSPYGGLLAINYAYEVIVVETQNWNKMVTLPIEKSSLSEMAFLSESQLVYASDHGICVYDIEENREVWAGQAATSIALSGDKNRVATINRNDNKAIIYDAQNGDIIAQVEFGDRRQKVVENDIFPSDKNNLFRLNEDGSMLAVSFGSGELIIYCLDDNIKELIIHEKSEIQRFSGDFYKNYFVYSTSDTTGSDLYLADLTTGRVTTGYHSQNDILVKNMEGKVHVANGRTLIHLDMQTFEEEEVAYTREGNITDFVVREEHTLVTTDAMEFALYDQGCNLLNAEQAIYPYEHLVLTGQYAVLGNFNETSLRILRLDQGKGKQVVQYDPLYAHDEARINHNGNSVMLFNHQQFAVFGKNGEKICEQKIPDAESVYDQQYRRTEEGEWLEVIWYDGTIRCYDALDGSLLQERKGEKPEKSLYEEFNLQEYRIVSILHESPKVYDAKSGELITSLEEEAYLAYAYELQDYIMTEYISAEGERFGILLDKKLQKIAYLPNLCDVSEGKLFFDHNAGVIKETSLYSLDELVILGEKIIKGT